jgi:5'-3' exonuclease
MLINLIVDGNYVFHQEYAIFSGWAKSGGFPTEREEVEFLRGVAVKFFYAVNNLPINGKVIFTFDSRSWRKAVEIPGGGYKSKRTQGDEKGGMDEETAAKFFSLMEEFGKYLSKVGVIVSRIGGAEGDDLIYRWSERFYKDGQSTVIISGDRDLTQLVRTDGEKWTIQWNNKKNGKRIQNTMFIPEGWGLWLGEESEMSIFNFTISDDKQAFLKLIRDQNITMEVVYPDEVVMDKILAGDDGDDVPPVWTAMIPNKHGEKKPVRMTGKKPGQVMDFLCEKYKIERKNILSMWKDETFMDDCAGLVLRVTKDVDGMSEREIVKEAMARNAKLVWLNSDLLPYNLVAEMDMHIDDSLLNNESRRNLWNLKDLFSGSRFANATPPKKSDPFYGMTVPE